MIQSIKCEFPFTQQSYFIEIGNGLINTLPSFLKSLAPKIAIITDDKIAPLHGETLFQSLASAGIETHLLTFPNGEKHKTRKTKEMLEDQLLDRKCGRDTCIIALGGGVVTDLAGYIAANFCRGIPLVTIPTSLVGMVDASIGGKNGINVPQGKNMLGSIYQPKKVIIDPSVLNTLSRRDLINGFVEMIKHGLIADSAYFNYLETHAAQLLAMDSSILVKAIFDSCRIKKEIVEQDEKEQGKRRLLNFGHTVGHALEKLSNYSIAHGEAVAIGLLAESYMAHLMGILNQDSFLRIKNIIKLYSVPLRLPNQLSIQDMLQVMTMDKKSQNGLPRFVIIDQIGSPLTFNDTYCSTVDKNIITNALKWMTDDLCCY